MAKAARKRRTTKTRSPRTSRRVSTRRVSGKRKMVVRESRPARAARAARLERARADTAETLQITFELRDVANQPISDPETFFTFRRLSDHRQIGDQLQVALTGAPAVFELPVATGEVAVCELDAKRYRFAHSPVFFRTPGPPITKTSRLLREPKEWTPLFTPWDHLSAPFAALKEKLGQSPNVALFKDSVPIANLLVDSAYDGMSGEPVTLAKTALLNTYYRLNSRNEPVSGDRTWFSFVSRVVAIGRERFLALVDPAMEALARQIHEHIGEFPDYERTMAENHRGNVPAAWQGRITSMISIKSSHQAGNFQLTVTHLSGPDEVLLDADIDESGDLLGHFFDLFKHKITGGTHPHDIHELLVLQEGQTPGFDLGYRLV